MPDTTPARPVTGVRVRTEDNAYLHDLGRDWQDMDGDLHVMSGGDASRAIACYARHSWCSVELVYGEVSA